MILITNPFTEIEGGLFPVIQLPDGKLLQALPNENHNFIDYEITDATCKKVFDLIEKKEMELYEYL